MKKFWMLGALALGLTVLPAFADEKLQRKAGDLPGPIDSIEDLQDTGRMLFKMADENNDGQISQQEAIDAGNLLVGGFFFRADKNGDGVLSPDEAKQAREAFLSTKPWVRYAIGTAKNQIQKDGATKNQNQNGLANLAGTFDTNNDKQLQATELRQAVQTAVQSGFSAADTNRDGQLSNAEVNAALAGARRQLAQAAFQQADTDNDGQISQAEFVKAIEEPARVAFAVMDLNHDGKLSPQEAQSARQLIATKLRQGYVREAPNSPRNRINSALGSATQPNAQPPAAPEPPQ
jgi:Ca2+-binding EF-hand superfamily protein